MNRRRLDAETLRDGVLATAGTLNPAVGGPMVKTPLEPEVYDRLFSEGEPDGLWLVTPDRASTRRSLYLFSKRNLHLPLLEVFDQPDTLSPCPVRAVSTFAPQALVLLNGPFLHEQSKAFASRLLREAGPDDAARVDRAYRLALAVRRARGAADGARLPGGANGCAGAGCATACRSACRRPPDGVDAAAAAGG